MPLSRPNAVLVSLVGLLTVVGASIWVPQIATTERRVPTRASAFLDALPGRAKVLNQYNLGGWMLWTARNLSPAVDGRTEIYTPAYLDSLFSAENMGPGWQTFVDRYDFDAAWLYRNTRLVEGLRSLGWVEAFHDDRTVVLLPPGAR